MPSEFRHTLLWLMVLLVGCGLPSKIKEEDMPRVMGIQICQRLAECDRGNYLSDYYGMNDCVTHQERALEELVDLADDIDCDYSDKGGARAYEDLATMDCDDFYEGEFNEALNKVWDDCALSFFL